MNITQELAISAMLKAYSAESMREAQDDLRRAFKCTACHGEKVYGADGYCRCCGGLGYMVPTSR